MVAKATFPYPTGAFAMGEQLHTPGYYIRSRELERSKTGVTRITEMRRSVKNIDRD
jgi:hypothetical protein